MKPATLNDLMYAVIHDDEFDGVLLSTDVLRLLEIALKKKLGLAALCSPARVDLGNGHILNITVEGSTPQPDQELRPEVRAFARLMELRMREKDVERGDGWKEEDIANLHICATSKGFEIERSIHLGNHRTAAYMAVDQGNFAMMISYLGGALTCGKKNDGIPCTMPAGSKCPDCGRSLIDYHGE